MHGYKWPMLVPAAAVFAPEGPAPPPVRLWVRLVDGVRELPVAEEPVRVRFHIIRNLEIMHD